MMEHGPFCLVCAREVASDYGFCPECGSSLPPVAEFTYRNHHGVVETRRVVPIRFGFGNGTHHKMAQWLLRAWCIDRKAERDFAMTAIVRWHGPVEGRET